MRTSTPLLFALLLCAALPAARAIEPVFPRRPALSPDGKQIAFGWRGDLWVVAAAGGAARRLTVHPAYDTRPVWSPDGRTIAFASDRFGNYDVFVMDATGGLPRRLTFHSAGDLPSCFSADGTELIFLSSRGQAVDRRLRFFRVSLAGGTPRPLFRATGSDPRISPDGTKLVFSRGVVTWHRKRYRGSAAHDIWLHDLRTGRFEQLTRFAGNDDTPCFGPRGESIYFRSDRAGTADLWRIELATRKVTRVGRASDDIRLPDVARGAALAVYERGDALYTLDLRTGAERRVKIEAPADERENRVVRRTFRGRGASEFAVSPDGKAVAFVIEGEVFLRAIDSPSKRAVQLTRTPDAREKELAWKNTGALAFVSDRDGEEQVYQVEAEAGKTLWQTHRCSTTRLTSGKERHGAPRFDPAGRRLAFVSGAGDLVVRELATGAERVLVRGWNLHAHAWSPDGRYLAYSRYDEDYNSDVWLVPAAGGEPLNLTSHPDYDYDFAWSESGRALVFISARGKDSEIAHLWLRRADAARPAEEWPALFKKIEAALAARRKAKPAAPPATGPVGKQPPAKLAPLKVAKPDPLAVRVDRREIFARVRLLSQLAGDEGNPAISPSGKTILFTGLHGKQNAIYRVEHDGKGLRVLVENAGAVSGLRYAPPGKQAWYLGQGGVISTLDPASGKRGKLEFEARLSIDRQGVRRQKFEECWRLIRDQFYDAKFHGVDWPALRERYRAMALATRNTTDFNHAIKLMLGELNASHLGISGPRSAGPAEQTGELGLDLEPTAAGPLAVRRVLPRGPAAGRQAGVRPGDLLLAVDGRRIARGTNLYELLADTAGQPLRLLLRRGAAEREVELRPVTTGADRALRYRDWVAARRRIVERASGGKLGYIHIQGMNWPSLERFERDLYARAHGKQGLLLDVRYNGGGWTTDMLLVMLQTRPHAYTVGRGGGRGYPQGRRPFYTWHKPVGLLCNEMSFSNAEIFSHAFRTLKLGPVIGVPTYGAVISTGAETLIDGARFRIPGRGWYALPEGQDMEFHAAQPDHVVQQTPESENAGTDPQLERAVEVLLKK